MSLTKVSLIDSQADIHMILCYYITVLHYVQ